MLLSFHAPAVEKLLSGDVKDAASLGAHISVQNVGGVDLRIELPNWGIIFG